MSFDWREFGTTLRNDVFATWFGWSIIVAIVVFPLTATIGSCWSESVKETIELAKLQAKNPRLEPAPSKMSSNDLMQWMVSRGVHPLVARCAIWSSPSTQCGHMMTSLQSEDLSLIEELIANPFVEVSVGETAETGLAALPLSPQNPQDYVKDLDFGFRSPTE